MKHDLIFHISTKKNWKKCTSNGSYAPESIEEEGFIHCSTGDQINDTANRLFKDTKGLLLIVIDTNRVQQEIKYERDVNDDSGPQYPHVYGALHTNAVLDKIGLYPEKGGEFNVKFDTNG